MAFRDFLKSENFYYPEDIKDVLCMVRPFFRFSYTNKKHKYFDVPCAFDIETSSFYEYDYSEDELIYDDSDIYQHIKGHIIKYNDNIISDFPDFATMRKHVFGIVIFSKSKGIPIDSFYQELSQLYPYYFPDDVINISDQLSVILDIIEQVRPHKVDAQGQKVAIMYMWQFGIFGVCIVGRTWDEFINVINYLIKALDLGELKRLIIYVHNLGYEFQFLRKRFSWKKVFALAPREPVYALTLDGVEFRCSYILSGYSLAKLGQELHTYHVEKKIGDLDYLLLRHSKTPLSKKELGYGISDVKVVMAYIMECIESDNGITRIPLTKTGYARRYVRNKCWYDGTHNNYKKWNYTKFIKGLKLTPNEYNQLKRGFQGGFTHGNPFYIGKVLEDVTSYDFTSSYPAVMISEQYPMSSGELVEVNSIEELDKYLKYYWCLFDVELFDVQSRLLFDNYISRSRCYQVERPVLDNGRIVSAEHLVTTITGEDWDIIKQFYSWSHARIFNFRIYKKAYLPRDFVLAILQLYSDKTTLKGVEGKEAEYTVSKGLLNSCFGMACTDIVRPEILYTGEWTEKVPDLLKEINKYNKSNSRFLFYPWGVAVTAYARRNLFTGILEFREDYIYSDTDSIKVLHADKHREYIDRYNTNIIHKLTKAMEYHDLPLELIAPKTIKGEEKPLGVWDFDGHYTRFKTLGAKRYMVEYDNGDISLTVSGLNKKVAVPYLLNKYGKKDIFKAFANNLYIPPDHTGKMTHTYIDDEREGYVTDYLGNTEHYNELSSVHLSAQDYSLSISRDFADYISSVVYL